jgi:hypothetical protein
VHVSALIVADAVSVREGLLHVLGGGISYVQRGSYPAPLLADIGILVSHRASARNFHINVALRKDGSPEVLSEIEVDGEAADTPDVDANVYGTIPLQIDARSIAIPGPGNYTLSVTLRGGKGLTTHFTAIEASPGT